MPMHYGKIAQEQSLLAEVTYLNLNVPRVVLPLKSVTRVLVWSESEMGAERERGMARIARRSSDERMRAR